MKKKTAAKRFTVADFFCGAGGFSEGFRQNGFLVAFGLDMWKPAVETHHLNNPEGKTVQMNILNLDTPEKIDATVPDTDVIIGSPPCVSFSYSNKAGKADKSLGIQLIEAYLRIVLWKKAKGGVKYWVMENVPNSAPYVKDRYTWKELGLPGTGPDLEIPVRQFMLASDYGAPQNRSRFVCGSFPVPKKTHVGREVLVRDVMASLGSPFSKPVGTAKDPIYGSLEIPAAAMTDHRYDTTVPEIEWKRAQRLKVDHGFMGKMDFPERTNRTSRTVTATQSSSTRESIIFASEKRKGEYRLPTIREISCFMGFPIDYQFEGPSESVKYKLVGNAVCPPMSSAIAKAIAADAGVPAVFVPGRGAKPSLDLTGKRRIEKARKPKPENAKFARHVPFVKLGAMRVELTNAGSEFPDDVKWRSMLHYGSAETAGKAEVESSAFKADLAKLPGFKKFESTLLASFKGGVRSASKLQTRFRGAGAVDHLSPDEILDEVKSALDLCFPESVYLEKVLPNRASSVPRKDFPVRILAALYGVNLAVGLLKA